MRVAHTPEAVAYCEFDERREVWRELTWTQMLGRVERFKAVLAREGLERGDRVGILLRNSPDWVAFDVAAMASGLVTVPLYLHDSVSSTVHILQHAACRLLLVDGLDRWSLLAPHAEALSQLGTVLVNHCAATKTAGGHHQGIRPKVILLEQKEVQPGGLSADDAGAPEELATLIYTSGTTGTPKGVMLSHKAVLWNAEAITRFVAPLPSDVFLSLLPLAHAFERTLGCYLPMMVGARVAFARSPDTLQEDFLSVRPTVFLGVPRLYERIAAKVRSETRANAVKRWLLELTADIGWQRFEASRERCPPPNLIRRILWPILDRLVAARIRGAFGGRLRIAVSGGAPLDTTVARLLCGVGLPLLEGYGLTETAPVVTATTFEESLPGSVGRPLHGVELALGEHDELLVKSPSMMLGYWHDADATREVLDQSGWLRTGDIAELKNGRVFIRGRMKDLIVLSTGENVATGDLEAAIVKDPLFDQVCIVGNARPCLVAIVVLDPEAWQFQATELNVNTDDRTRRLPTLRSLHAFTRGPRTSRGQARCAP